MKRILFVFLVLITAQSAQAQETTRIWIVRHGEKVLTDPKEKDPELSTEGKERAEALLEYLKGKKIDVLFSTDYKRTRGTLSPLATQRGLGLKYYDSKDNSALVDTILNSYKGKNVLICSHSNRILGIITAFGALSPIKEITEQDYSHIFLLEIKGEQVKLKHKHYGKL